MLKYDNTVSSTIDGKPIYGAQVSVFTAEDPNNPTLASLYADEAGTVALSQPILTDQLGYFAFYIPDGKYDIRVMTGVVEISRTNITMVDTLSLKNRALVVPQNEDSGTLPPAGERAGKLLAFDGAGLPQMAVPNSFAGPTGPANSTYTTKAAMQAAQISDRSYNLASPNGSDGGVTNGTFFYRTDQAPYVESNDVVRLTAVPLMTGALVRQGADSVTFQQRGPDALPRPLGDKARDFVSVLDFIPPNLHAGIRDGTGTTPVHTYIQKAIDSLATTGGTVWLPLGIYHTTAMLLPRSGVSIEGAGRFYLFVNGIGNVFRGSWLRYRGPNSQAALYLYSVLKCTFRNFGIDCGEAAGSTAIDIRSNNAPACKTHLFTEMSVFGATKGVKWGGGNAETPIEQCDDITFREIGFHSCFDGFVIDAANSSDYSRIDRCTFDAMGGTAFDLRSPGFLEISQCAAGTLNETSVMFKITGASPDPLIIKQCQNEGFGKFMTVSGANDEQVIMLDGCPVNRPIETSGICYVLSRGCYFNSTLSLSGFTRWVSTDDRWAGVHEQPTHVPQVILAGDVPFTAEAMSNAGGFFGYSLPTGFKIRASKPVAGNFEGRVVVSPGVYAPTFVPNATYTAAPAGEVRGADYVVPNTGNGHAYMVTTGGVAGAEPVWPTSAGATITSGAVTFKEIGTSAILRGYGPIQA